MATIKLISGDAAQHYGEFDLLMTDPPFEMPGAEIASIIKRYQPRHVVLVCTMRQAFEPYPALGYEFAFDFVLDAVTPKQSKALHQPNYTHSNGFYFKLPGVKSAFNRKRRPRSDQFVNNGFWPTMIRAPRENLRELGYAKSQDAWTDILGSFDVKSVVDPFAGTCVTAFASAELGLDCTVIEIDAGLIKTAVKQLKFMGVEYDLAHTKQAA